MEEPVVEASQSGLVDAHVGKRMRQRREALGVSQSRLGQQLGLTFSQVQKYENGSNRIGAGRLYLMARILKVPVQYFYEGLGVRPGLGEGEEAPREAELALLDDAFLSIPDPDTRASLIALVRSLAEQGGRPPATRGGRRLRAASMV